MYALVNYKGNQILLEEGTKVKIPYQKDLKEGSTLNFDQVIFFDDGKKKHVGSPYLKSTNFQVKIDSHSKESKVVVFKKKRRKGHQKKNGHKQLFTLIQVNKLKVKKNTAKKAAAPKKTTAKSTTKKAVTTKKTKK
jgi:large subunit ribosomal protein L21